MKTDIEIKDIIFEIIAGSTLETSIAINGGKIYQWNRPANAVGEGLAISVVDGSVGEFQEMVLDVDIYVPDVTDDDKKMVNILRIKELSRLAIDLFKEHIGGEYRFRLDKQSIFKVPEVDEHCINNRLLLTHLNY